MSREFVEEVRALHNHICILHDTDLVRVIGIHFDGMDAYYRVQRMGSAGKPGETFCSTMVGGCQSLKDVLPRYERTEELFAMNGCPPTAAFSVTADTRRRFGEMGGDHALAHYDGHVAPLLIANGGQPDTGGGDPAAEARAAFNEAHPGHEAAIARMLWIGTHQGSDRFINPEVGGFDFDRATGAIDSDLDGGDRTDAAAVMSAHAA